MWGIEFKKDTSNSLICVVATFEVRKRGQNSRFFKYTSSPNESFLNEIGGYEISIRNPTPGNIDAILPKKEDFGHKWTYEDFLIALTFFGDGLKLGSA